MLPSPAQPQEEGSQSRPYLRRVGSAAVPRRGRAVPLRTWWEDVRPFLHHQGLHQSRCSWGWRRPRAPAPGRQRERFGVSTSPSSERTPGGYMRFFAPMLPSLFMQVQHFFASVIQFAVTMSRVCVSHSCALGLGFLQGRGCTEFKSRGQRASALRTLSQPLLFGHKKPNPNNRQYLPTQYFFLSYSETNFSSTSVPHTRISYSQLPFYVFFLVMNYKSPIFIQF